MARRKKNKKNTGGVPDWVVTFGDLMSLLLTFFFLLQMFSQLKQHHEYQRVITAVREAFGYSGGVGVLPIDDPPVRSIIEQLEQLAFKQQVTPHTSKSPDEGMEGPSMRVTKVREGLVFTIGGPTTFDPESAVVKEPARPQLEKLASMLVGRTNKIVIRGHAANKYLSDDSQWDDLYELSYARARNVMKLLAKYGVDERMCRLEAVGRWEPVKARAVGIDDTGENRRVEVILTETTVDDVDHDAAHTDADIAQGS